MKAENIEINANDVEMLQLIPLEENIYRSKIIIKIEKKCNQTEKNTFYIIENINMAHCK